MQLTVRRRERAAILTLSCSFAAEQNTHQLELLARGAAIFVIQPKMRIIRVTSLTPADSAPKPSLPYYGIPQYSKKEVDSMNIVINEEIAPEIARAIITQATL